MHKFLLSFSSARTLLPELIPSHPPLVLPLDSVFSLSASPSSLLVAMSSARCVQGRSAARGVHSEVNAYEAHHHQTRGRTAAKATKPPSKSYTTPKEKGRKTIVRKKRRAPSLVSLTCCPRIYPASFGMYGRMGACACTHFAFFFAVFFSRSALSFVALPSHFKYNRPLWPLSLSWAPLHPPSASGLCTPSALHSFIAFARTSHAVSLFSSIDQ